MEKRNVRIRLEDGEIIEREAQVGEWLTDAGRVESVCLYKRGIYQVVDRDYYGAIFGSARK